MNVFFYKNLFAFSDSYSSLSSNIPFGSKVLTGVSINAASLEETNCSSFLYVAILFKKSSSFLLYSSNISAYICSNRSLKSVVFVLIICLIKTSKSSIFFI